MYRLLFGVFAILGCAFVWRSGNDPTPLYIEQPFYFPEMPVAKENPLTEEGVYLGRKLFHDPILSRTRTFACATCHRQEFAFSDGKQFAVGPYGDTLLRNTPGLFNLAWYSNYFWDGRSPSLEHQVFEPVRKHDEMDLDWKTASQRIQKDKNYRKLFKKAFGSATIDSVLIAKAIAQFERTLISANSKFDRALKREVKLTEMEYKGFEIMNDQSKGNCLHCHITDAHALGTNGLMSNNGLQEYFLSSAVDVGLGGVTELRKDYGKFKIPSLRNLIFTAPYMHDGRFQSLEEVLDFYSEGVVFSDETDVKMTTSKQGGVHFTDYEKKCVIAFLKSLSDSSFIKNPNYSSVP